MGPDSHRSDGNNTVIATGISGDGKLVSSNTAVHTIAISEGVFTTKGIVIGHVFQDNNFDGIQNGTENGVAGVLIYLEDGTRVKTDASGRYSINGIRPGLHVARLDETSLAGGAFLIPSSKRFMGGDFSQFVDMPPGGLVRADFALGHEPPAFENALGIVVPSEDNEPVDTEEISFSPKNESDPYYLEKQILSMNSDVSFLDPKNASALSDDHVNVLIKLPMDRELSLQVNGRDVDSGRIGRTITNPGGNVAIYEFVSLKLERGAENQLRAIVSGGSELPEAVEISVYVVGDPVRIVMEADRTEAPADGDSIVNLNVSLVDDNGQAVERPGFITISASLGDIIDADIDPVSDGHQVVYRGGKAVFAIRAPREVGKSEITGAFDNLIEKTGLFFSADIRDAFTVGFLELTVGHGDFRGESFHLNDYAHMDNGVFIDGQAAFFTKKQIAEYTMLTAALNSRNDGDSSLFRSKETDNELEENYPLYGDESETGYEAISRNQFYLRIDRKKSHLLYGDFATKINDTTLSAYNRSFNGLSLNSDKGRNRLRAFASSSSQTQVVDKLQAKGISGYYNLSRSPVIAGSERVVIETRDRDQADRVLERRTMVRWSDYNVDYELGVILFKQPVESVDLDFNPVFIIVSYESEADGNKYYVYGIRNVRDVNDRLKLGFTGIKEEQDASGREMFGADATLRINNNISLNIEWAETQTLFTRDSSFTDRTGSAWSAKLDGKFDGGLDFSAYYRRSGTYFDNPSATEIFRGRSSHGLKLRHTLSKTTSIYGEYFDERDRLNEMSNSFSLFGFKRAVNRNTYGIELVRRKSNDMFIAPTAPNTPFPFGNGDETPDEMTALKFKAQSVLRPDLTLFLQHQQDLDSVYNRSSVGLNYKVNGFTDIYMRDEYGRFRERDENRFIAGLESRIARNTTAFNEYRLERGADGSRVDRAIGINNKFQLSQRLRGGISLELLDTLRGNDRENSEDSFAGSMSLEYLADENKTVFTKYEYKTSSSEKSFMFESGITLNLNSDYSLHLKGRHFHRAFDTGNYQNTNRAIIGIAYRPVNSTRFDAFAKMVFESDKDTGLGIGLFERNRIFSIEEVYRATKNLQLTGKYAGKWAKAYESSNYTEMWSTGYLFDINKRVDIGADYRILNSNSVNSRTEGGSVQVGYRIIKNLQIGVGYSFDKFDADLTGDDYWGKGPFIRLRFKFDENSFKEK